MFNTTRRRPAAAATAALAAAAIIGSLGLTGCTAAQAAPQATAHAAVQVSRHGQPSAAKQVQLYTAMSDLWSQHMEWTYSTVIAFAQGSPNLGVTLTRLLQNQADIGNAITPYYGTAAASQLTTLLKAHINDAVPVLTAAKQGDSAALSTAVTAWYANAKQIADFLAAANPAWNKADMEQMLKTHITQTIAYATDALQGNWAQAITDYGTAEAHMEQMADMLSAGIVHQFPQKFQ